MHVLPIDGLGDLTWSVAVLDSAKGIYNIKIHYALSISCEVHAAANSVASDVAVFYISSRTYALLRTEAAGSAPT